MSSLILMLAINIRFICKLLHRQPPTNKLKKKTIIQHINSIALRKITTELTCNIVPSFFNALALNLRTSLGTVGSLRTWKRKGVMKMLLLSIPHLSSNSRIFGYNSYTEISSDFKNADSQQEHIDDILT